MNCRFYLVYLLVIFSIFCGCEGSKKSEELKEAQVCEDITIPMCQNIGYNQTRMPNQLNHATQEEAGLEVHQFWPLVKIECSEDIRFFLCSMYTPICIDSYSQPLPACRSVCERAKRGCLPVMQKYGFDWPSRMSCTLLPEYGGKELCMDAQAQDPKPRKDLDISNTHRDHIWRPTEDELLPSSLNERPLFPAGGQISTVGVGVGGGQCTCPDCSSNSGLITSPVVPLRPGDVLYNESVSWASQIDCAAPCFAPYFTHSDREFTELWLTVWSLVCCVSTALTFATFLLDPMRNNYPERSIMYLSLCYFMISMGFLFRISLGHQELSCTLQDPTKDYSPTNLYHSRDRLPAVNSRILDEGDLLCTLVFFLIYMFTMASALWWLILTLTWFLTTVLKWAEESLVSLAPWFHLICWGLPTLKSGIILALSGVQGDNVAGICYTGTRNTSMLMGFVISPLIIYHLLGLSFMATGLVSLVKFRQLIKEQTQNTRKLDKLMIKISIFSVLYFVPVTTLIACYIYEYLNVTKWEENYLCRSCQRADENSYPNFSVFMLKYFMQLAVGITSGFWIWSGKSIDAWASLLKPLCIFRTFDKVVSTNSNKIKGNCPPPLPLPRILGAPNHEYHSGAENHYATIPVQNVYI